MSLLLLHNSLKKKKSLISDGLVIWIDAKDFINSPTTSVWRDRSGNGNNITASGFVGDPSYSGADGFGNVLFDGINDMGTTDVSFPFHLSNNNFTLNFAGALNAINTYYMLMSRRLSASSDYEFIVGINNGGAVEFKYSTNSTSSTTLSFPYTFSANTLYDINVVKSGTTVSCYINNTPVGTPATLSGTIYSSGQSLVIGASNSSGIYGNFFKGKFKRTAQYSRDLSLQEIIQNSKIL